MLTTMLTVALAAYAAKTAIGIGDRIYVHRTLRRGALGIRAVRDVLRRRERSDNSTSFTREAR